MHARMGHCTRTGACAPCLKNFFTWRQTRWWVCCARLCPEACALPWARPALFELGCALFLGPFCRVQCNRPQVQCGRPPVQCTRPRVQCERLRGAVRKALGAVRKAWCGTNAASTPLPSPTPVASTPLPSPPHHSRCHQPRRRLHTNPAARATLLLPLCHDCSLPTPTAAPTPLPQLQAGQL